MWYAKYVGIPFVEMGRERDGLDCWGLVRLVYDEVWGIGLPTYLDGYSTLRDREAVSGLLTRGSEEGCWNRVEGDRQQGDVLLFRVLNMPLHVGLVADGGRMLHCERFVGTVLERYGRPPWRDRLLGAYRYEL